MTDFNIGDVVRVDADAIMFTGEIYGISHDPDGKVRYKVSKDELEAYGPPFSALTIMGFEASKLVKIESANKKNGG